jgi:hypothetical protein
MTPIARFIEETPFKRTVTLSLPYPLLSSFGLSALKFIAGFGKKREFHCPLSKQRRFGESRRARGEPGRSGIRFDAVRGEDWSSGAADACAAYPLVYPRIADREGEENLKPSSQRHPSDASAIRGSRTYSSRRYAE